ncbi:MAG: nucleotide sugar dehydrogenase [Pseudanabaenaceae cyanobacterium]
MSAHPILTALMDKIRQRTAIVGVVGMGYVGLPFAVEKAKVGFKVIGIEENPKRVEKLNVGESYIDDVPTATLRSLVETGQITATSDFQVVAQMDVIVICVPTPLTRNLTPNLTYVEKVTREISKYLHQGQLVSLESTTYPGTTDELMRPILENTGLKQGVDFFLAHSPERVDPGNQRYTTKNTNKIVGASDPASLQVAQFFYEQTILKVVPVSSAKAAELVKVFENTFRAVNIALVNELALLCDRMELNVWEVLDAANTKPFGIMPFYPGPGVGGHCIPLDPHYLEWKAKEFNFETHFIALAGEINRRMPEFVREKTWRVLNKVGIAPSRAVGLILGVAYKRDIADWRESPAIDVMHLLLQDGMQLHYHDPLIPEIKVNGQAFHSQPLTPELLNSVDIVLITTDHTKVDYSLVVSSAKAIFDTRGITRHLQLSESDRLKITLL